jgi:hypothetical protein
MVHCFSFSKKSTNSVTVASSTPNFSWLGCEYEELIPASHGECVDGAALGEFEIDGAAFDKLEFVEPAPVFELASEITFASS